MSLFGRIMASLGYSRVGRVERWYPIGSTWTNAGLRVTPEQAMRTAAVFSCVKVIAETVGTLPKHVSRRLERGKQRDRNHRLYDLVHTQPNNWQTSAEFFEMGQAHLCLRGNFYAHIVPEPSGYPQALEPLHPDTVTVERNDSTNRLQYRQRNPGTGQEKTYQQDDILHVRGLSFDGVSGLSPIAYMAESIGIQLAADQFTGGFYRNGANFGNILEHPNALSKDTKEDLKRQLREEYAGATNAGKTLVLQEGMKWQRMGMEPRQAQFIETMKFRKKDICGIYRVPPHMIGELEDATYSNIEQQSLDFGKYCVLPWLVRWEQAMQRDLFGEIDPEHFVEFVIEGLLRGDILTRTQALALQKSHAIISQNEWRDLEGRNPVEGGDELVAAANLMGNRGGNPDATATAWVDDVAQRIASAELRALRRRAKGTYGTSFTEWLRDFYGGRHANYIREALAPLLAQTGGRHDALVGLMLAEPLTTFATMTVEDCLVHVERSRAVQLRTLILEEIQNGQAN